MALKVYFTGHRTFANHGCEALVRSTVTALNRQFGEIEAIVPSVAPDQDLRLWNEGSSLGVRFSPAVEPSALYRWWNRLTKRVPPSRRLPWPRLSLPPAVAGDLLDADLVMSIGGDNYSLDYDPASLFMIAGVAERAMKNRIPVVLWGASVGPFTASPTIERQMRDHLSRMALIVVRESLSLRYLESLGLADNLRIGVDPAFFLEPEPFALEDLLPPGWGNAEILGFNVSPLLERFDAAGKGDGHLHGSVARFLSNTMDRRGLKVLLIPHVTSHEGRSAKRDHDYMQRLMSEHGLDSGSVHLLSDNLNAAQLKYAISRCRWFMGARTHATIAALSSGVPTASIAYSVKARGLNRDIFGHEDHVVDGSTLTAATLGAALDRLIQDESEIRKTLEAQKHVWHERLDRSLRDLDRVVRGLDERN